MSDVILENANGVRITEGDKMHGHHIAVGALCCCGEHLIVAPTRYHADHRKGDPVMVCRDHGVHAFRFLELVEGRQRSVSDAAEEARHAEIIRRGAF